MDIFLFFSLTVFGRSLLQSRVRNFQCTFLDLSLASFDRENPKMKSKISKNRIFNLLRI